MQDINMEEELKKIKFNFHKNYNGIFLNDEEKQTLEAYGFDIHKYNNIKELMFELEDYLLENDCEELEIIANQIAEFNYYHNTIK